MRRIHLAAAVLSIVPSLFAQLTPDQKVADFMQLAAIYAKNYEPYEWKRDVIGFDALNVKPWLAQVQQTTNDLDFFDVCVRYVASLQDSHDEFTLPSDFEAWLHFDVDIFDGKVLIEIIDRTYLPATKFPFRAGDELVSVDGKSALDWVDALIPYSVNGSANVNSRRRLAAQTIVDRYQPFYTYAPQIGDSATIVVQRQSGATETYTIPWDKFGTPLITIGAVPTPKSTIQAQTRLFGPESHRRPPRPPRIENPWGVWTGAPAAPEQLNLPRYMQTLHDLQISGAMEGPTLGYSFFGRTTPLFNPPPGFRLRLGGSQNDQFLSGTYPISGRTIGFIRIYTMSPTNTTLALQQFQSEMTFFQQNTDGMIIDVMNNGGGSLCYVESLVRYLSPKPFRSIAYNIRATQFWVEVFSSDITAAKNSNAPQWVIDLYTAYRDEVQTAVSQFRGDTGDLPICGTTFENIPPATDSRGNNLAYTKPILVLTSDLTLSAGEAFAMLLQDAHRATIFGSRTDGGGGNPASYNATTYSEAFTRATRTFVTRAQPVQTPGFPASRYLENTGVYPDMVMDYQTVDNLLNGGKTFVDAATGAILTMINHP